MILQQLDGWLIGPYQLYRTLDRCMCATREIDLNRIERRVLGILAEAGGRRVTRDQFFASLWPSRAVGESTPGRFVGRLRKELGAEIIETHHTLGYRLTCPVEPIDSAEAGKALEFTTRFVRADRERHSMRDEDWDDRYAGDLLQVQKVLDWALAEPGRRDIAIDLAGATARLWERCSRIAEGRHYLDRAVDLIHDDTGARAKALLLQSAGMLSRESHRQRSLGLLQRAAEIWRQCGDNDALGTTLGLIGDTQLHLGDHILARKSLDEAYKLLETSGRKKAIWNVLNGLGLLSTFERRTDDAKKYFDKAFDLAYNLSDKLRQGIVTLNTGEFDFIDDAIDRAIQRQFDAISYLSAELPLYRVRPLVNLATLYCLNGNTKSARSYARQALFEGAHDGGYWLRLALLCISFIAAQDRRYTDAARLLGFVDEGFRHGGEARQPAESKLFGQLRKMLGDNLRLDSISVWQAEGARWSEQMATEIAETIVQHTDHTELHELH